MKIKCCSLQILILLMNIFLQFKAQACGLNLKNLWSVPLNFSSQFVHFQLWSFAHLSWQSEGWISDAMPKRPVHSSVWCNFLSPEFLRKLRGFSKSFAYVGSVAKGYIG